nr:hypothetical protein [Rhizobium leguminosarum]
MHDDRCAVDAACAQVAEGLVADVKVRQTPQASTLTTTWPCGAGGSGRSTCSSTIALTFPSIGMYHRRSRITTFPILA